MANSDDLPIPPNERIVHSDGSITELTDIPLTDAQLGVTQNRALRLPQIAALPRERRGTLLSLCYDLFVDNWHQVTFGPCLEGALFELHLAAAPITFSYLDGYLTVYVDPSPTHLHLCIGEHRGLEQECPNDLRHIRRCRRATFVRTFSKTCVPATWAIRLFNGVGDQMITFYLPSPYLDIAQERRRREPAWEQLALWNALRARYLGERFPQPLPSSSFAGTMTEA